MAARGFAAVLLLSFLSQDWIIRRDAVVDKIVAVDFSDFSDCVGDCSGSSPAGVRTRSLLCKDQDDIRHSFCSGSFTENCCSLSSYFSQPSFEECNPNCGSTDSAVLPIGSFLITNVDGSISNVSISDVGNDIIMIVVMTTMDDGGAITITQTRDATSSNSSISVINPRSDTFGITSSTSFVFSTATFRINGADIVEIPEVNNFIRETISSSVVEYESSAATLLNPGVPVNDSEGASTFYYISPLGLTYEFSGSKITRETGEGLLFVDSTGSTAIFSQFQLANDLLLANTVNQYQIQITNDGELVLRLNSVQDFFLNNAVQLATSGETLYYDNGIFSTASQNISVENVYTIGSAGFEAFGSSSDNSLELSTLISVYDAVFLDASQERVVVSTSSLFSKQVMEGKDFIARSNNSLQNDFTLDGSTIIYNGIEVLQLSSSTQVREFSETTNIIYSGETLRLTTSSTPFATGVRELFFQQSNGVLASSSRSVLITILDAGSVLYTDDTGNAVGLTSTFTDSIAFFSSSLDMVLNPSFPTAPSSAMFSLVRDGQQVFIQIAGMNVLEASSSSCQDFALSSGDTVTYDGGVLSFQSTVSTNIMMLTVASNGQNVILLTDADAGYSIELASSYNLTICSQKAVLANTTSVQSLIESAAAFPGVVEVSGQRTLFLGSTAVLQLTMSVLVRPLTAINSVELRSSQLTIRESSFQIEMVNMISNLVRFLQSDTAPVDVTWIDGIVGKLYAISNDSAFFTDSAMINDVISNELASGFEIEKNSLNQTVLVADGSDVIILNGVESIDVAEDQSLRFDPSNNHLEVLDYSNNVVHSFTGVSNVDTYLSGGPVAVQMLQMMTTIGGPLSLFAQSRMGDYFVTNNPLLEALVDAELPVTSLPVEAVDGGYNNILLTFGSMSFSVENERSISSSSSIQYSNSVLSVGSQTISNIDELIVYLTSDAISQSYMGSVFGSIAGSGTLYTNENRALFTDRPDIIAAVDTVTVVPPPDVTTRTGSDGRVVLVIGGEEEIVVNERPILSVLSSQDILFDGSSIMIRNAADGTVITNITGITSLTSYLVGDTAPTDVTAPQVLTDTPGRLVITSDSAFYTNRPDVINVLDMDFDLLAVYNPDTGYLEVGGEIVIQLNGSARINVENSEAVIISGMTITVVDTQNSNAVLRTFTDITNPIRYLNSDSSPVSNPGDMTIPGPVTLVVDVREGNALITDRREVISAVNTVLPGMTLPALSVGLRDDNGTTVLVIDMMDITDIDGGSIHSVSDREEIVYEINTVMVRNFLSGEVVSDTMTATRLVRYLSTDSSPITFTGTGPSSMGPSTLFFQPNKLSPTVFVTDHQEIADLLREALDNFTASATSAPATPEPPVTCYGNSSSAIIWGVASIAVIFIIATIVEFIIILVLFILYKRQKLLVQYPAAKNDSASLPTNTETVEYDMIELKKLNDERIIATDKNIAYGEIKPLYL